MEAELALASWYAKKRSMNLVIWLLVNDAKTVTVLVLTGNTECWITGPLSLVRYLKKLNAFNHALLPH